LKVHEVVTILDNFYPPELAAAWDNVGLQVGDLDKQVNRVMVALDPSEVVVVEAVKAKVDLLITHHPLVMSGVNRFTSETSIGRVIANLNSHGISLFAAHTNADVAQGGVNDVLADRFELIDIEPLLPLAALSERDGTSKSTLLKIVVFTPIESTQQVIDEMAEAGAGQIGNYDRCAYQVSGVGTFRPQPGADPHVGEIGQIAETTENRIEMVLRRKDLSSVVEALRRAHPYEEPAFDVIELVDTERVGLGRKGRLQHPATLQEFAERVSAVVPRTHHGVRVSGDLMAKIESVGVITGAAANFLPEVAKRGIDCYVTADSKHHVTLDNLMANGPNLIDLSHWASESPWCDDLAARLNQRFGTEGEKVEVMVSTVMGDPWSLRLA
jgi:dinuclear metal center YbgI/SA1388 family protein